MALVRRLRSLATSPFLRRKLNIYFAGLPIGQEAGQVPDQAWTT
jgi:hypothetical protein